MTMRQGIDKAADTCEITAASFQDETRRAKLFQPARAILQKHAHSSRPSRIFPDNDISIYFMIFHLFESAPEFFGITFSCCARGAWLSLGQWPQPPKREVFLFFSAL